MRTWAGSFLEPGDIMNLNLGGHLDTTARLQGSHDSIWGTKYLSNYGLGASGLKDPEPTCNLSISNQAREGITDMEETEVY